MAKPMSESTPLSERFREGGVFIDNELQTAFRQLSFEKLLTKRGFDKASGDPLIQVVFAIVLWPFFRVESISAFAGSGLNAFIRGGVNVLYDFQKRRDPDWARLRETAAEKIFRRREFAVEDDLSIVFDDTVRERRGAKAEGASLRYDHLSGGTARGRQILEAGLACSKGYIPLRSQIYMGSKKAVDREKGFSNSESAVAKDFETAKTLNKNQMLRPRLKEILQSGFKARYVLADSWFSNAENISAAADNGLTGVFRAKKSKAKYRRDGKDSTASDLYSRLKTRLRVLADGRPDESGLKTLSVRVETKLPKGDGEFERRPIQLPFVRSRGAKRGDWSLFLRADPELPAARILEIYKLRWSVEVYFKEAKQNLGFLKERTGDYVCRRASLHLAALRYLLFSRLLLETEGEQMGKSETEFRKIWRSSPSDIR